MPAAWPWGLEGLSLHRLLAPAPPWLSPSLPPAAGQLAQAPPFWMGFACGRLSWPFQVQIPVATISEILLSARQRGLSSLVTRRKLASRHHSYAHYPIFQIRKSRHRDLQPLA